MKKNEKLTFPITDTLPGPGIYKGETDVSEGSSRVPALKPERSITELGHGIPFDVSSTPLTANKDKKR